MEKDNTTLYIIIALGIIAVAIMVYFYLKKKEEAAIEPPDYIPGDEDPDSDPYIPPGSNIMNLDRIASYAKKIKFDLGGRYYATSLAGNVRPGGSLYTNVKIYYSKSGTWKKLGTVGGWPGGSTQFAYFINDQCDEIIFEAEQGLMAPRYIDEVHGQIMIEVG